MWICCLFIFSSNAKIIDKIKSVKFKWELILDTPYHMYIYVIALEIEINGLTPQQFYAGPKSGPGFPMSYILVLYVQLYEVILIGNCSFCWYWWNCWSSLFKCFIHKHDLLSTLWLLYFSYSFAVTCAIICCLVHCYFTICSLNREAWNPPTKSQKQ